MPRDIKASDPKHQQKALDILNASHKDSPVKVEIHDFGLVTVEVEELKKPVTLTVKKLAGSLKNKHTARKLGASFGEQLGKFSEEQIVMREGAEALMKAIFYENASTAFIIAKADAGEDVRKLMFHLETNEKVTV